MASRASSVQQAAAHYRALRDWVVHSRRAVEYLTIVDTDYTVLFNNQVQPGLPDPIGVSCLTFLPPDQQPILSAAIDAAARTGLPHHFETVAAGPDDELSYYSGWCSRLLTDTGAVHVALVGTDITHLRRIEEKLAISDETLRSLVANAPDFIAMVDREHRLRFINRGQTAETRHLLGQLLEDFLSPEERARVHAIVERAFESGEVQSYETRMPHPSGTGQVHFSSRLSPIKRDGQVSSLILISRDITEQLRARASLAEIEERLRQSEKLKAIGQLAGGIAHDFNNLLTVINGNLQLARMDRHDPEALLETFAEIEGAVVRASSLTQRLLAIGRRQRLDPTALHPPQLLHEMAALLRRTLGPQVTVRIHTAPAIWHCSADRSQLESAILNLAINARDAMGAGGGTLTLAASNYTRAEQSEQLLELMPGDYVQLVLTDDGPGMNATTRAQAFEPFFTTKPPGKGSGLGLAMVYGFAQQSGGHVTIESAPDQGAAVSLFLPRSRTQTAAPSPLPEPLVQPPGVGQVVLLVEDMPVVARLTMSLLERLGYRPILAPSGQAALELLARRDDIELLFSDIGLPDGLNGVELARQAQAKDPGLAVLLMTGFDHGLLGQDTGLPVLPKPFDAADLSDAVQAALASKSG